MSASEDRGAMTGLTCLSDEQGAKSMVSASAITRSLAPHQSSLEKFPRLSERATHRIHEFILKPLLAKDSLKDFHPLVADCPRRINEKEIVCLRDLEKTLMFMAPVSDIHNNDDAVRAFTHWFSCRLKERSNTAKLYLDFCLTSIRCIQATVEYLSDRERTRPHDRPYTSGYFIDLVDQIRNYAQSVRASKEKENKGETLDEMDVELYVSRTPKLSPQASALASPIMTQDKEPSQSTIAGRLRSRPLLYKTSDADHPPTRSEEVKLYGGITKNGRPAELVRVKKDGTAVSLATGKSIKMESIEDDEKGGVMMKRSLSEQEDDDESVMRSMARRKRSTSAAELAPKKCHEPGCTKEFKRSCDLTKHEKTHSRPWKCQDVSCKYHEYGWPTEKELDRHVNDKHSACPKMYKCQFPPCPYQSKRESNCKQHMEKSHNWVYVRSKNNGKNRDQPRGALPTPQTTTILTPDTENQPTPEEHSWDVEGYEPSVTFNDDIFPNNSAMDFPSYPSNIHYTPDLPMQQHPFISPAESNLPYSSVNSSPYLDMDTSTDFPMDDISANFGSEFATGGADFTLYEDLYSARAQVQQLPTPDQSIFTRSYQSSSYMGIPVSAEAIPHISPVGQGNAMLYTPVEETFDSFMPDAANVGFGGDFPLFGAGGGMGATGGQAAMFGELPSYGMGLGQGSTQDFLQGFYNGQNGWGEVDEGFDAGKW